MYYLFFCCNFVQQLETTVFLLPRPTLRGEFREDYMTATQIIYLPLATKIEGGDYISGRDAWGVSGAKGVEVDSQYRYFVPSGLVVSSAPSFRKEAEQIMIEKYDDFSIMECIEEDEHFQQEFEKILKEVKSKYPIPAKIQWVDISSDSIEKYDLVEWNGNLPSFGYCNLPSNNDLETHFLAKKAEKEESARSAEKAQDLREKNLKSVLGESYKSERLYSDGSYYMLMPLNGSNFAQTFRSFETLNKEKLVQVYTDFLNKFEARKLAQAESDARILNEKAANSQNNQQNNQILTVVYGKRKEASFGFESDGFTIKVPKSAIGHLVGRGGSKIFEIQKKIGKRVSLVGYEDSSYVEKAYWNI